MLVFGVAVFAAGVASHSPGVGGNIVYLIALLVDFYFVIPARSRSCDPLAAAAGCGKAGAIGFSFLAALIRVPRHRGTILTTFL